MMSSLHPAGDAEDMYSGFGREDVAPALDTADLEFDSGFQVWNILAHCAQIE